MAWPGLPCPLGPALLQPGSMPGKWLQATGSPGSLSRCPGPCTEASCQLKSGRPAPLLTGNPRELPVYPHSTQRLGPHCSQRRVAFCRESDGCQLASEAAGKVKISFSLAAFASPAIHVGAQGRERTDLRDAEQPGEGQGGGTARLCRGVPSPSSCHWWPCCAPAPSAEISVAARPEPCLQAVLPSPSLNTQLPPVTLPPGCPGGLQDLVRNWPTGNQPFRSQP